MPGGELRDQTALAFDHGARRIGLAVVSRRAGAAPLRTLEARGGEPRWPELGELIREWQPQLLVVGVPYNADGSVGDSGAAALAFAAELERRFRLQVVLVDERLTSAEAESILREQRRSGTRRRRLQPEDVDRISACLIGEAWLAQVAAAGGASDEEA